MSDVKVFPFHHSVMFESVEQVMQVIQFIIAFKTTHTVALILPSLSTCVTSKAYYLTLYFINSFSGIRAFVLVA